MIVIVSIRMRLFIMKCAVGLFYYRDLNCSNACEIRKFSQFDSMEFALIFFSLWKTDNDNVNNLSILENGMCRERSSFMCFAKYQ